MSTVIATSVLPDSTANNTLTIGATGDSVAISGDSLNLNTLQDAGGNTIFVSDGSGTITSQGLPGAMKFISSQTGSAASSISFTTELTSTYDVYCFKFYEIHPSANANFQFNGSTDGGLNYDTTKTTTWFRAEHYESDASSTLAYAGGNDLAQSTAYQMIFQGMGVDNDDNGAGELWLFAPSSTIHLKHFYSTLQYRNPAAAGLSTEGFCAGYMNTTSAVNALDFKMASGTFDGTIALYGISKS